MRITCANNFCRMCEGANTTGVVAESAHIVHAPRTAYSYILDWIFGFLVMKKIGLH